MLLFTFFLFFQFVKRNDLKWGEDSATVPCLGLSSASKINQAICKRKLAEERPRQGTVAETSPPLKSFLLTNWKKRKKVKNR